MNPQYVSSTVSGSGQTTGVLYVCSCTNSSYNSGIVEYTKRFSRGFGLLASYTFSKTLGASEGGTFPANWRTIRNWSLDKHILSFNEAQVVKISGTYELPFGPGKPLLNEKQAVLGRIVGGWQFGAIFTYYSGSPLNLTSATSSINQETIGTPYVTQAFAASTWGRFRRSATEWSTLTGCIRSATRPWRT